MFATMRDRVMAKGVPRQREPGMSAIERSVAIVGDGNQVHVLPLDRRSGLDRRRRRRSTDTASWARLVRQWLLIVVGAGVGVIVAQYVQTLIARLLAL